MHEFFLLLKGDQTRLIRYGVTYASLAVSVLWIVMIHLASVTAMAVYLPLFIFVDTTMMSFLLVGVAMIFEKQESAVKTMMVTPISKHQYLLSKIATTVLASLTTLVLLGGYGVLFRGLAVNVLGLLGGVILSAFVFSCLGILFTYRSKDFTILLMWVMGLFFGFSVPTIFQMLGIITANWFGQLQYLNPTQAVLTVLQGAVMEVDAADLLVSVGYLVVLSGVCYYSAARSFDGYITKELGGE